MQTRRPLLRRHGRRNRDRRPGLPAPGRPSGGPHRRGRDHPRRFPQSPIPAPLRSHGQAGDLAVPVGRALPDGPVRLQAGPGPAPGRGAARVHPPGPAPHQHDLRAGQFSRGAFHLRVRPTRPIGRLDQRAPAPDRRDRRRPLLHPVHAYGGHQSRSGGHVSPDRRPDRRAAQSGGVAGLRPGEREQQPAGLRGHGHPGDRRAAALRPPLGQRLPAQPLPGSQVPFRRGPGPLPLRSQGLRTGEPPAFSGCP